MDISFFFKVRLYFHILRTEKQFSIMYWTGHHFTILNAGLGALVIIDFRCHLTLTLHLVTSSELVNIQVGHPLRILAVLFVLREEK